MPTKLAHFAKQVATLAQKVVVGSAKPVVMQGNDGNPDWVTVSIHGLKTHLDPLYRRRLDVLHETPRISRILGLEVAIQPDFTACRS